MDGAVFYDLLLPFFLKKTLRRQTHFLIPSHSIVEIAFLAGTPQDDMLQDDSITGKRDDCIADQQTKCNSGKNPKNKRSHWQTCCCLWSSFLNRRDSFPLLRVMQCLTRNGKLKTLFSTGF